jgi:hypothetical protein
MGINTIRFGKKSFSVTRLKSMGTVGKGDGDGGTVSVGVEVIVGVKVGVLVGVFVAVDVCVIVGVGVSVGPNNCPGPQPEIIKPMTRQQIMEVFLFMIHLLWRFRGATGSC